MPDTSHNLSAMVHGSGCQMVIWVADVEQNGPHAKRVVAEILVALV